MDCNLSSSESWVVQAEQFAEDTRTPTHSGGLWHPTVIDPHQAPKPASNQLLIMFMGVLECFPVPF